MLKLSGNICLLFALWKKQDSIYYWYLWYQLLKGDNDALVDAVNKGEKPGSWKEEKPEKSEEKSRDREKSSDRRKKDEVGGET